MSDGRPPDARAVDPAKRPDVDAYFSALALLVASRATCARRRVGCVLVDGANRVLATGYNGVPAGFPHCSVTPCPGASAPLGQSFDSCLAVHAEVNAVLLCSDVSRIRTAYCTTRPCASCTKVLLNTACRRIVCLHDHSTAVDSLWAPPRELVMVDRLAVAALLHDTADLLRWVTVDPAAKNQEKP